MTARPAALFKFTSRLGTLVLAAAGFFAAAPFAAYAVGSPTLHIVSGANQQTRYTSPFAIPLMVRATDSVTHTAIAGVSVRFTAPAGIALSAAMAKTDRRGQASVIATGLIVGSGEVEATLVENPAVSTTFEGLVIQKALLTVVPADLAPHVGIVPAITDYVIQGFVNGESLETAKVTGAPVLSTSATERSPDANYAIKGGVGSLAAPNYEFVAGFGTLVLVGDRSSARGNSVADEAFDPRFAAINQNPNEVRSALTSKTAFVPAPTSVAGGSRNGVAVNVRSAVELHTSKATSPLLAAEVKGVSSFNRTELNANLGNAKPVRQAIAPKVATVSADGSAKPVQAALTSRTASPFPTALAGVHRAGVVESVRSALQLNFVTSPSVMPSAQSPQAIHSAFPVKK